MDELNQQTVLFELFHDKAADVINTDASKPSASTPAQHRLILIHYGGKQDPVENPSSRRSSLINSSELISERRIELYLLLCGCFLSSLRMHSSLPPPQSHGGRIISRCGTTPSIWLKPRARGTVWGTVQVLTVSRLLTGRAERPAAPCSLSNQVRGAQTYLDVRACLS